MSAQLTLESAQRIAAAARAHARSPGHQIVVAIVDAHGCVKVLECMDGAPLGSIRLAQHKAAGAALLHLDGPEVAAIPSERRASISAIAQMQLYPGPGALVIRSADEVVGAIGVSGCPTSDADHDCARAGLATFPPSPNTFVRSGVQC